MKPIRTWYLQQLAESIMAKQTMCCEVAEDEARNKDQSQN